MLAPGSAVSFRLKGVTTTGRIARNEPEWMLVETANRGRWLVRHQDAAYQSQRLSSETAEK